MTPSYLRNSAMHYLSTRAASTTMLRRTLERRAKRRLCLSSSLPDDVKAAIEQTIKKLVELGLIDDETFGANHAASLARRGYSRTRIKQGLAAKGISGERGSSAVPADYDDLTQARRYAERRRLGPWRRNPSTPDTDRKDLGAMARAGFSLDVARRALAHIDDE